MTTDDDLVLCLRSALADNPARVQRVAHRGQFIWLKRRETLGPLRRLQKGDAAAAFEAERSALRDWRARQAPGPALLAEGEDFFATADAGSPLDAMLTDPALSPPQRIPVFASAAQALAGLHRNGMSHGRPSLKDICWDGARITFLDLERYSPRRNTPKGHAMDLVMFVFNGLVVGRGMTPEMQAAIAAYRAGDSSGTWDRAVAWCHRMRWLEWVSKPAQWRPAGRAREFRAIPLTLRVFSSG